MSFEVAEGHGSGDHPQIMANVVFVENVSLDEEHKNAGGAPVEDESPIGQDVGWWTAVFLSMSTFIDEPAQAEPTGTNRPLADDWNGYVLLSIE